MKAPIQFHAVQELAAGGVWRTIPSLFSAASAAGVVRAEGAPAPRRSVAVDLDTGWSEVEVGHYLHASGAEVRASETRRGRWRFRASPRVAYEEIGGGHWGARWAALGYAVVEPG